MQTPKSQLFVCAAGCTGLQRRLTTSGARRIEPLAELQTLLPSETEGGRRAETERGRGPERSGLGLAGSGSPGIRTNRGQRGATGSSAGGQRQLHRRSRWVTRSVGVALPATGPLLQARDASGECCQWPTRLTTGRARSQRSHSRVEAARNWVGLCMGDPDKSIMNYDRLLTLRTQNDMTGE